MERVTGVTALVSLTIVLSGCSVDTLISAEEPGKFVAEYWPDQAPLEPDWSINLSLPADRVAAGEQYPGGVFYRESDDGFCLVDVAWWTAEIRGTVLCSIGNHPHLP